MNMKKLKLLLQDRGTGKTHKCITVAGLTDNTIIICHDELTANRVNDEIKIKKMECKALSVWEYINNIEKYRNYNIIIDELDLVLKNILKNNILFATGTYFNIIDYRNEVEV